jgi:hypothetical protein
LPNAWHSGGKYQRLRLAGGHRRPREHDAAAPQDVIICCGPGISRHRPGLTGYRGVVYAHPERLEKPAIGWNIFTGAQKDDVAGNQILRWNDDYGPGPLGADLGRQQPLQRRHRLFGPVFLPEREQAVDHNHADDREAEGCHALAWHLPIGNERERRRDPQQNGEEVCDLCDESSSQRCLRQVLNPVRTELQPPRGGFAGRQPVGAAPQAGKGGVKRELMNERHADRSVQPRCPAQSPSVEHAPATRCRF